LGGWATCSCGPESKAKTTPWEKREVEGGGVKPKVRKRGGFLWFLANVTERGIAGAKEDKGSKGGN